MKYNVKDRYLYGWQDPRATYPEDSGAWTKTRKVWEKVKRDLVPYEHTPLADSVMRMIMLAPIYRLKINDDRSVDVDCYDMLEDFKPELKKFYGDVDNLPEWVQNQVAVLMLLDPNNKNSDIEGVGRRITKNVFWIYKKGEQLGDDTGSQG